ncbi:hypothetical protein ACJJIF_00810 [Microbulbifer sp. SSSA002]|uniref:hypothetical protein n=1 Tax=unclassified Microbulbifer TaxID=2619833 RepID=UPI0040391CB2
MIEEVVGGFFRVIGHFLGHIFIEIIFELLLKGPGYFISKQFTKRDPDPDGLIVVLIGFLFWIALGIGAYSMYATVGGANNV